MKLWKVRRSAYRVGRVLGDVEAVERSIERGSVAPIAKRVERRWLWRLVGRLLGRVTR
ncbi:MAG TPA: hypothetical protein VFA27_02515 [Vicinamibacterales bacterium]|nr:hypothetical protein [Vicinamibacterales bacterium]